MSKMTRILALGFTLLIASSSLAIAGGIDLSGLGGYATPYRSLPQGSTGNGGSNPNFKGGQAGDIDTPTPRMVRKLACIVGGAPAQLPKGILVGNTSNATLIAGTKLDFIVPSAGVKGSFVLSRNLPAGTQLEISDLFGGALAGSPCSVKVAV